MPVNSHQRNLVCPIERPPDIDNHAEQSVEHHTDKITHPLLSAARGRQFAVELVSGRPG